MFEKLNKVQVQHIACVLVLCGCFALAFIAAFFQLPQGSEVLINKVTDLSLMGVVGYLFSQSKGKTQA